MLIEPFSQAMFIIQNIEKHGYQAFFVGGCVRDLLLDRPIGDIDIATSAMPEDICSMFSRVIPIGIKHGTVIVRHHGISYEITTFRADGGYSDQRHPDTVKFIQTIDEDLKRRDFTMNALAMDKSGVIIDLFHGKMDIRNTCIRAVGNGHERFMEDPLRIIRGIRFSAQLGFVIDNETLSYMNMVAPQIRNIAVERIATEFSKLFAGDYIHTGIDYIKKTGVRHFIPVIPEYPGILDRLPKKLQPLCSFGEILALFHYLEPRISILTWVNEWKCSNKIKMEAQSLAESLFYFEKYGLDRWMTYQLPSDYYPGFLRLAKMLFDRGPVTKDQLQQMDAVLPIHSKQDIAIDGNDLHELFPQVKKGPWMKTYLKRIEKSLVCGSLENDKNKIKEWIKWNPPEIN